MRGGRARVPTRNTLFRRAQILDILTDDYREGVKSHEVATVAAAGEGLPPEDCAAAADAGSNAVADMRNVPPPEEVAASSAPRQVRCACSVCTLPPLFCS